MASSFENFVVRCILVPEITQNIVNVDIAMKNGFLWKKGPFEMLDELGPSWFADKLKNEGLEVPKILESIGDGLFYSEKGLSLIHI